MEGKKGIRQRDHEGDRHDPVRGDFAYMCGADRLCGYQRDGKCDEHIDFVCGGADRARYCFRICSLIFKPLLALSSISLIGGLDKMLGAVLGALEACILSVVLYYVSGYLGFYVF